MTDKEKIDALYQLVAELTNRLESVERDAREAKKRADDNYDLIKYI